MKPFLWILVSIGIILMLFCLDQLALRMERRGWLYYRKTKKRTGANLGDAFLEIQSLIEPAKKYLLEIKREEKEDEADSGEPSEAGRQ